VTKCRAGKEETTTEVYADVLPGISNEPDDISLTSSSGIVLFSCVLLGFVF